MIKSGAHCAWNESDGLDLNLPGYTQCVHPGQIYPVLILQDMGTIYCHLEVRRKTAQTVRTRTKPLFKPDLFYLERYPN